MYPRQSNSNSTAQGGQLRGRLGVTLVAITVVLLVVIAVSAQAWRTTAFTAKRSEAVARPSSRVEPTLLQSSAATPGNLYNRLLLQPQADRLRRRLGQRYSAPGREASVYVGAVNTGAERYTMSLVRQRDDDEERLTIALNGGPPTLSWSSTDGARVSNNPASGVLRTLAERLALDSPDQFVLAQLRGASYFNVATRVRPAEAGSARSYSGPLWDLVRVAEPAQLTSNSPQSLWRLYYINSATGLIDKVVSQEQGQTITAELSGWVNQKIMV